MNAPISKGFPKNSLLLVLVAGLALGPLGCKKAAQTSSNDKGVAQPGTEQGASGAVLLKAKWPLGARYVYQMELDQRSTNQIPQMPKPMQQDTEMGLTYALSVMRETTEGGRELEMEFLAEELRVKMGEQQLVSFNSKERAEDEGQDPLARALRAMVGSKLRLLVDPAGKALQMEGFEEWRNNLALEDAGPGGQALSQQFNPGFFQMLADFGRGFRSQPVSLGETWPFKMDFPGGNGGKIAVDAKITFKGWENVEQHHCARLESQGVFTGMLGDGDSPIKKMNIDSGRSKGTSWFEPEAGALIKSVVQQSIRVKGEVPSGMGGTRAAVKFTSDIGQTIKVKLIETGRMEGRTK